MSVSRVLLLAAIALLPMIRPAGPMQLTLADAALIALMLFAWLKFWRSRASLQFPLIGPHWLIWTGSLIATMVSANVADCLVTLIQDVYIYAWFVTVCNVLEREDLFLMGRAWVVTALIESGLIVLGGVTGVSMFANEWGRSIGTFINPNMASSYVVTSFFVYMATPFPRSRYLRVAGGALIIAAAVVTGSNAGLAALVVGAATMLAYRLIVERHALWPWLGLAALAGAAFLLVFILVTPSSGLARLIDLGRGGGVLFLTVGRLGSGMASRANIWSKAWRAFQHDPLGLGPGASRAGLGGELHNDFLSHLVERGGPGLLGLLWAAVATFIFLGMMARIERDQGRMPLAVGPLLAGFAAAVPVMLSHEILHFRHHWLFLALSFAQLSLYLPGGRLASVHSWRWACYPLGGKYGGENVNGLESRTCDQF